MELATVALILLIAIPGWRLYRHRRLGVGLAPLSADHLRHLEQHLEQMRDKGVVDEQECNEFRRLFQ